MSPRSDAPGGGLFGQTYTAAEVVLQLVKQLELATGKSLDVETELLKSLDQPDQLRLLQEAIVRVGLMPEDSPPETLRGGGVTVGPPAGPAR